MALLLSAPAVSRTRTHAVIRTTVALTNAPITTFFFRRVDGSRGSATSLAAIPSDAVIERRRVG